MRLRFFAVVSLVTLATLVATFTARDALADKVAVFPFKGPTSARQAELDAARDATKNAVAIAKHTSPTDSEMLTGQMAVKGGAPSTTEQYRAAGRASGADWTAIGHIEPRGATYTLELEVCQVVTGRVESLVREIDPASAPTQVAEMLALLVRPEGIGNAEIPWLKAAPPKPPALPAKTQIVTTAPKTEPPAKPEPPAVRHAYAENRPLALGLSLSVLSALSRAKNAQGGATSFHIGGSAGYAIDAVPGLELRGDIAFAAAGPQSLLIDAGARYAFAVAPTARFFVGPEAALGTFVTLGGDARARFLARASLFAALGVGERVQVELAPDFVLAPGGSSALVLFGGTARAFVRF